MKPNILKSFRNVIDAPFNPASAIIRAADLRQLGHHNFQREIQYDKARNIPGIFLEQISRKIEELEKTLIRQRKLEKDLAELKKSCAKKTKRQAKLAKKDLSTPLTPANRGALSFAKLLTILFMSVGFVLAITTEVYLNTDLVAGLHLENSIKWIAAATIAGILWVVGKAGLNAFNKAGIAAKIGGALILGLFGLSAVSIGAFRYQTHLAQLATKLEGMASAMGANEAQLKMALDTLQSPISALAYVLLSLVLSVGALMAYQEAAIRFDAFMKELKRLRVLRQQAELKQLNEALPVLRHEIDTLDKELDELHNHWVKTWREFKDLAIQRERAAETPKKTFANFFASFILVAFFALSGCTAELPVKAPQTTLVFVDHSKSMPQLASRQHADTLKAIVQRALVNPQDRVEFLPISGQTSSTAYLRMPIELPAKPNGDDQTAIGNIVYESQNEHARLKLQQAACDTLKALLFHPPRIPALYSDLLGTVSRLAECVRNKPERSYRMVVLTDGEQDTKSFKLKRLDSYVEAVNLAKRKAKELQQKEGIQADLLKDVVVEFYLIQSEANTLSYLEAFYKAYYEAFGIKITTTLIPTH
jgi:hypothetical protein